MLGWGSCGARLVCALGAVLLVASPPARALEIRNSMKAGSPAATGPAAIAAPAVVPLKGTMVEGFGRDIPLAAALAGIVPSMVRVDFAPGLDRTRPVSWDGGRPWQDVAIEVVTSVGYSARLDGWGLFVEPPAQVAAAPGGMGSMPPAPVDVEQRRSWTLERGRFLSEVLAEWASAAAPKWQIVWEARGTDYPIVAAATIEGTFFEAATQLLEQYVDADPPLDVVFKRGNRAVVIKAGNTYGGLGVN